MSRNGLLSFLIPLATMAQDFSFSSRFSIDLGDTDLGRTDVAVVSDFNSDGLPDIAVPGYGTGVSVFLGLGEGRFGTPRLLRLPSCWSLVDGDFDGDGNADLAGVEGSRNAVFVIRGDGAGGFFDPVFYPAPPTPFRIAAADLNLDGWLDLLVSDRNANTVSTLFNQGDGRFQSAMPAPAGLDPTFLVTGDFTGDCIPDVVTVNFEQRQASLLAGSGDGHFLPPAAIAEGTSVYSVTAGDFNGDGRLDLAFGTMNEYAYVLLQADRGGFASGDWYWFGRFAHLVAADVDADGRLDLFGVLRGGTGVVVLQGTGDGHFGEPRTVATISDPSFVVMADMNGDDRPDAVVTSYDPGVVTVLVNPGDGTAWRLGHVVGRLRPTALAAADFDGDGQLDLAVTTSAAGVLVLRGFGDGTMGSPARYAAGGGPAAIVAADWNQDGFADLAVANANSGDVSVLLNNGDGTFANGDPTVVEECAPTTMVTADFNYDGIPDIGLGCRQANAIVMMMSRGDGTFAPAARLRPGATIRRFAVADFSGDSVPDLALLGNALALYFGNGDGSFRGPVSLAVSTGCSDLIAGDWNSDAAPDLAVACPGENGLLVVFLNTGSASFLRTEIAAGASAVSLAGGDLTGDGRPDLVLLQQPITLATFAGNGDGSFRAAADLAITSGVSAIQVADFNGDGRADLVTLPTADAPVVLFLSSPGAAGLEPPVPLSPVGNEVVPQNNPVTSCPVDPIRGSGVRLLLRWTRTASVQGVVAVVQREGAANPLVVMSTSGGDSAPLQFCTFFPDTELEGWIWRIRSQDTVGNLSRWSDWAEFRWGPCRLADGRPCGTTAPTPPPGQILLSMPRVAHSATLLRNGKVLVAGGTTPSGTNAASLPTAELYDPVTRAFLPTGRMQNARAYHTATLLLDGRVLLAGGTSVSPGSPPVPLSTMEIYDPERGTFTPAAPIIPRNAHTATLLNDGRVLLAGGLPGQGAFLNVAEVFQPTSGTVSTLMPMVERRGFHTATLLRDGRVVMIGGEGINPEFFVPSSSSFVRSPAALLRLNHAATLLPDGRVLVTGGVAQGPVPASPVIFDASTSAVTVTGGMLIPRSGHTATMLADGRVLVMGGASVTGESLAPGELFLPSGGAFTPGPTLAVPRTLHTATLLADGTVLVVGGFRLSGGIQTWIGTAEVIAVGGN
jgi:hypothetical protein